MVRPTLVVASLLFATGVAAQDTSLRAGSSSQGSLAEGDTATYTIEAGADYFVMGEVDQVTVDVVVRILDPDGRQMRRIDGPARGPELFFFETDQEGLYEIQVIGFEDEAGDFEISLDRLEAIETDPTKLVDQLMSPYDRDDSPGAVVAVWRDGRTLFSRAYGMASLSYGIPFEVDTRTNIGSTSKQFTAFAIMLQAERGKLSLDDDIRTHIPELPEFDETITVRHLITHTSGLREFLNLLSMTGRRMDHGDFIDRAELIEIVQRQPALQNAPGSEWNYNNTAFGLAAVIVERTSGQDFHEFMQDNVFGPLGMTRTMVRPSPEHIVPDRSEGYTPAGDGFREVGDLAGAVGAGGIYTTVRDLQTWVENFSAPRVGSHAIFDEMMTSYVLTDGEETGYGYGLFIDEQRGLKRIQHGGADVAHRSMLAYYPQINAGLTTQSNHAGFDGSVAFRLAEAFFGEAMEPAEDEGEGGEEAGDFDPAEYDAEDFDEFVGRYALDALATFILTFTREADTLFAQATGQPRLEIVPTSDTTFALTVVDASIVFHRNEDGEVDGASLNQNGQLQHATRLASDDTEAWEPTVDDLSAFEGRYFSEELETFYTTTLDEEQLVMYQRRIGDRDLTPGEKDTFSGGGMTVSFERDRNGQVIGFYLSNGRTRNVRFDRVR
jgi:CubicO group peptidase (beta-lactamase class C family)